MTTANAIKGCLPAQKSANPLVSILIPAFNAEKWIRQCIESALSQTYSPIEIIVVDDGSTDGTVQEVRRFGDRVKLIIGKHAGANASRNLLTRSAHGEWLQYLDADDYLLPNKVADHVHFLQNNDRIDVVYSPTIIRHEDTGTETPTMIEAPFDATVHFVRWTPFCTHGMLLRRSAVLDSGSWKEDQPVCQEHELVFGLICKGSHFGVWNQPGTVYRQHSENTVSKKDPLRTVRMRMEILDRFEKWLIDSGRITRVHRKEIYAARLDTARVAWVMDETYGEALASKALSSGRFWVNSRTGLPMGFQLWNCTVGFRAAQKLARFVRVARASRLVKVGAYPWRRHRAEVSARA